LNHAAAGDAMSLLDDGESEEVLAYVAALASSLAQAKVFTHNTWIETLMPYMESLPSMYGATERAEKSIQKFCDLTEQASYADDDTAEDEEDEFGGEQLTDIRFSLAYGGKILLHNTKLRLRRGHRYALVGRFHKTRQYILQLSPSPTN
jgi:elongation factor 3